MLVLTRKIGESIVIGNDIELFVLETDGNNVKLGVKAPKQVDIYRKEVYVEIQKANKEAATKHKLGSKFADWMRKNEKKS
ncbi:carbon storage regulator CsrA [Longirhabdus pacifica]|uniref:carbon storage regulator CsrA n=1 Tax=Longirhabdus pacifica TaxID=2305227 RepID=UPI001008DA28|nr:carbon storage regulator CsrA [Longirhabdus pacifica]